MNPKGDPHNEREALRSKHRIRQALTDERGSQTRLSLSGHSLNTDSATDSLPIKLNGIFSIAVSHVRVVPPHCLIIKGHLPTGELHLLYVSPCSTDLHQATRLDSINTNIDDPSRIFYFR